MATTQPLRPDWSANASRGHGWPKKDRPGVRMGLGPPHYTTIIHHQPFKPHNIEQDESVTIPHHDSTALVDTSAGLPYIAKRYGDHELGWIQWCGQDILSDGWLAFFGAFYCPRTLFTCTKRQEAMVETRTSIPEFESMGIRDSVHESSRHLGTLFICPESEKWTCWACGGQNRVQEMYCQEAFGVFKTQEDGGMIPRVCGYPRVCGDLRQRYKDLGLGFQPERILDVILELWEWRCGCA